MNPAPKSRVPKGEVVDSRGKPTGGGDSSSIDAEDDKKAQHQSPRRTAKFSEDIAKETSLQHEREKSPRIGPDLRRTSSTIGGSDRERLLKRSNTADMREHLKHLGPSNLASRPRQTRYNTVKIKPGSDTGSKGRSESQDAPPKSKLNTLSVPEAAQDGIYDGLISSGAKDAQDGALAVLAGYGTITPTPTVPSKPPRSPPDERHASTASRPNSSDKDAQTPTLQSSTNRKTSSSTLGSQNNGRTSRPDTPKIKKSLTVSVARSGCITKNIVEAGGTQKMVLEQSSSSEELADQQGKPSDNTGESEEKAPEEDSKEMSTDGTKSSNRKKRRRRKRKGGPQSKVSEEEDEEGPLILRDSKTS